MGCCLLLAALLAGVWLVCRVWLPALEVEESKAPTERCLSACVVPFQLRSHSAAFL